MIMVLKTLSCVFRLSDGITNKVLTGNEAGLYIGDTKLRHQYKEGGYFVVCDLPCGEYDISVRAYGFQTEIVHITVTETPTLDVIYLTLNASENHPSAARMSCVKGKASDVEKLYVIRNTAKLRVAEEKTAAGAQEIKMFAEGASPVFPLDCLLGSGAHSEIVTFTANENGVCKTAVPMKYAHKRSESALPLIRLQCDEGSFFLLVPNEFSKDKETGNIPLKFAALKSGKVLFAEAQILPMKKNDIGELKLKGDK